MSDKNSYFSNIFNREEFVSDMYERHPRIVRIYRQISNREMSGELIKIALNKKSSEVDQEEKLKALETPSMWSDNGPIVISQYTSYASPQMTNYWNTVLPKINDNYGPVVTYEHYDVPVPENRLLEYKLATVGRAIQHYGGNKEFWDWFNAVMVEGVQTTKGAYDMVERLDISVDRETVRESVEYDLYENILWNDVNSLLNKEKTVNNKMIENQLKKSEPVFELFVNGIRVQPTYDAIVGEVENALPN